MAVLPGDLVHLPSPATRPGPGIVLSKDGGGRKEDRTLVCKAGLLRRRGEEAVWVHNQQKRVSHVVSSHWGLVIPRVHPPCSTCPQRGSV